MNAPLEIVQLKIRLLGISPMIWRRVLVPTSVSLRELHGVLQVAMGWEGVHLFLFGIHAVQYGSFDLQVENADAPLGQFRFREKDRFSYVYDMGDHWEHDIRVEAFSTAERKKSYPVCIGGAGACPPEDCGGPDRYLAQRDEVGSFEALMDVDVMAGFLEDVLAAGDPEKPVSDFMSDDVEIAARRMAARKPFLDGSFSRGTVNKRLRANDHLGMMHQQM